MSGIRFATPDRLQVFEVSNLLNEEQLKLWSILSCTALESKQNTQEQHSIPVSALLYVWGMWTRKDQTEDDLKRALLKLRFHVKHIEFKNKRVKSTSVFTLLPSVSIIDGICSYWFCSRLDYFLSQPIVAAFLDFLGLDYIYRLAENTEKINPDFQLCQGS